MFFILLTYKKPLEEVDLYLEAHRAFLDEAYKNNLFLLSGPLRPRSGGIIISQLQNRDHLEATLKKDPFWIHELANYQIMEFTPTKWFSRISEVMENLLK